MQNAAKLGSSVGVVVRDLDAVLRLYTDGLGLGPFEIEELDAPSATSGDRPAPARLRVATAPLGPCELELIEVDGGRPPHADFIDARGEGMNHFNLDKITAEEYLATLGRLYHMGVEPFWGYPYNSFCYVDSEQVGGVTFEVMVGSGHAGKKGYNHLGLVVANTDETIDFYTKTMGLGPFRTNVFPMPNALYRDQRIECSFKASFCDLGDVQLRVIQVLDGETPLTEQLASTGEGMHHLCVNVSSLNEALAELASAGVEPTWTCPEARLAYLDTRAVGGMTFAVAEAV